MLTDLNWDKKIYPYL